MAAVVIERAMNLHNANHLHPFFGQTQKDDPRPVATELEEQPSTTENETEPKNAPKRSAKRSKKQDVNGQRTILQGFGINSEVAAHSVAVGKAAQEESQANLETDPNYGRRKRQKTASPEGELPPTRTVPYTNGRFITTIAIPDSEDSAMDWHEQLQAEAIARTGGEDDMVREGTHRPIATMQNEAQPIPQTSVPDVEPAQTTPTKQDRRPTRTIRLKGGKLASPISVVSKQESPKTPKQRGRPRKSAESPSLLVKVKYGKTFPNPKETGRRIQSILDGEVVHPLPARPPIAIMKPKLAPTGPPKPAHPFFTGKLKKPEAQIDPALELPKSSPRKASTTTPGKLRTQRNAFLMPELSPKQPTFKRSKLKHAGNHPAWPTKEDAHVRGLISLPSRPSVSAHEAGFVDKSAKRKKDVNEINKSESILRILAGRVDTRHRGIREPTKIVTTGFGLQNIIIDRLSCLPGGDSHQAVQRMYDSIEATLSSFDKYECESLAWTQKYMPKNAAEVLQAGKEAHVLKDWLQRSTISAVQTSSKRSTTSSTTSTLKTKKKRKRKDDPDDFIVQSDEELDEQNEMLPLSDSSRSREALGSLARGGDDYAKSTPASTVLLSGPHGSGKTAAVYAVAKELGFEIFEINSATRRSGKDILDKIGNMTENHLVQQVSKALIEGAPITESGKLEAIKIDTPDTPDPKQKSMGSFFKAGPAAKKPVKLQKTIAKAKDEKPARKQKQSLILLEEVDILFEEDKQFWLTVLTLAAHSKRPIIMTCNDEHYIPEAFDFHAILRFVAPPVDLAVDYLLCLAAREGHILERNDVESLYKTKACDLRASITELNFWCQMAIGDSTRGLNWMLDRYPPGIDVDEHGRTLRTASEGTFVLGMNVVPFDLVRSQHGPWDVEEEESMWAQAWDDWRMDVSPDHRSDYALPDSLDAYDHFSDLLSCGDVCFGFGMRSANHQRLDAALPLKREKAIASYALGLSGSVDLLQAEPMVDYTNLDRDLAIASQTRLFKPACDHEESDRVPKNTSARINSRVEAKATSTRQHLTRSDFSSALDIFAADLDDPGTSTDTSKVTLSSFDRSFNIITTDLAPYIRTIVREYQVREEERVCMSSLLSAGGAGKRRQTRNAFAAMDGGRRSDRRARYFETWRKIGVDVGEVLGTGGEGWSARIAGGGDGTGTGTGSVVEDGEVLGGTQESDELHA